MPTEKPKRILIAPLDWGTGHTTRCMPLIRYLQRNGHQVIFAGNSRQRTFIRETFRNIDTVDIDGYDVQYSAKNNGFRLRMLSQFPRLYATVHKEHQWLQSHIKSICPDGIISDNRYGLFHPSVPSVIMTHQLRIQTGMGQNVDSILQKTHYKFLERFQQQWIVDVPGNINLSGQLAHPGKLPANGHYIGLLSQFLPSVRGSNNKHLLVLLSGPEPQRSILSGIVWEQLKSYNGAVVFVSGNNDAPVPAADIPGHISYYGQVNSDTLLPLLQNANMVICRSGYSTLMDLIALQQKAIVIPTPGQTEQEYLGAHLHEQGIFYCTQQKQFNLHKAISESSIFPFKLMQMNDAFNVHTQVLDNWLKRL